MNFDLYTIRKPDSVFGNCGSTIIEIGNLEKAIKYFFLYSFVINSNSFFSMNVIMY